jgi:threonyl-tRNA synthetase
MHGLFRVRGFTQDDAHIFCLPSQIASEIKGVLDLTEELLSAFGFTQYEINLSTRPEKSVGDDEIWATAEAALKEALGLKGWDYVVDEVGGLGGASRRDWARPAGRGLGLGFRAAHFCFLGSCQRSIKTDGRWGASANHLSPRPSCSPAASAAGQRPLAPVGCCQSLNQPTNQPTNHPSTRHPQGGGAFYGPKIDIKIQDALGRKWQCSTIQLDFNLPTRFDMSYVDNDASRQRPIMIHRAIFGSLERFFGILVENYAGAFPFWLAPVQVRLLPVNDAVADYTAEAAAALRAAGVRVEVMERASIAKMIRTAERAKTPVMAVVGAKEAETRSLALRLYGGADLGSVPLDEVATRASAAVAARSGF